MKKISLKHLDLNADGKLTREQLKNVFGSSIMTTGERCADLCGSSKECPNGLRCDIWSPAGDKNNECLRCI